MKLFVLFGIFLSTSHIATAGPISYTCVGLANVTEISGSEPAVEPTTRGWKEIDCDYPTGALFSEDARRWGDVLNNHVEIKLLNREKMKLPMWIPVRWGGTCEPGVCNVKYAEEISKAESESRRQKLRSDRIAFFVKHWDLVEYYVNPDNETLKKFSRAEKEAFLAAAMRLLAFGESSTLDSFAKEFPAFDRAELRNAVNAIQGMEGAQCSYDLEFDNVLKGEKWAENLTRQERSVLSRCLYHGCPPSAFGGKQERVKALRAAAAKNEEPPTYSGSWSKRPLAVVASKRLYKDALKIAKDAAKRLGYPLNLRGHKPVENGLTASKKSCAKEGEGHEYPCYIPRFKPMGRIVSVEHSTGYSEFAKNFYVVVIDDSDTAIASVKFAKEKGFTDAYAKNLDVYTAGPMDCGH